MSGHFDQLAETRVIAPSAPSVASAGVARWGSFVSVAVNVTDVPASGHVLGSIEILLDEGALKSSFSPVT